MHHPPCRRHNPDNRSGRPIIPIPRGQALLFLVTLCILAGCTTPRILIDHAKQRPEPATKRTPVGAKVPATQRPYIIVTVQQPPHLHAIRPTHIGPL